MKKIISYSLWGDNPKYTIGALKNAILPKEIFPDWICRFYIGSSTPSSIAEDLEKMDNTEVILMNESGEWNSMFWRFFAIGEEDVEIMLSRDCDSRLSMREKYCVDEFLKSNKFFHTMIDHPFHSGIMAGMWGAKKGILKNIKELIEEWPKTNRWQTDQSFLNSIISPLIKDDVLIHDSINLNNFPSKRENYEFVGEVFDANDNRYEHWVVFLQPQNQHLNL